MAPEAPQNDERPWVLLIGGPEPVQRALEALCAPAMAVRLLPAHGALEEALSSRRDPEAAFVDAHLLGAEATSTLGLVRARFPTVPVVGVAAPGDGTAEGHGFAAMVEGRAVGLVRDVTRPDELRAALALARAHGELAATLGERERALQEAASLGALGFVCGGIAHELRNALTPLMMNLELAQLLAGSRTADDGAKLLALLQEAFAGTQAIAQLVDSVRSVGRAGSAAEVDVAELLQAVCRPLAGELRRRGRLELCLGRAPRLFAPPGLVGQLLLNLLVQGLDHLAPERRAENVLRVELSSAEDELTVEVSPRSKVAPAPDVRVQPSRAVSWGARSGPELPSAEARLQVSTSPLPSGLALAMVRRLAGGLGASVLVRGSSLADLGYVVCFPERTAAAPEPPR